MDYQFILVLWQQLGNIEMSRFIKMVSKVCQHHIHTYNNASEPHCFYINSVDIVVVYSLFSLIAGIQNKNDTKASILMTLGFRKISEIDDT